MKSTKLLGRAVVLVFVAGGATMVTATSAEAVGGTCSSGRQEKEDAGYNSFRVRAYCSALNADSKAKGVLDKANASDPETAWFTQIRTYKYSNYTVCSPIYPCDNTRVKIEHV